MQGFSIIEVLVAMTVGLTTMVAALSLLAGARVLETRARHFTIPGGIRALSVDQHFLYITGGTRRHATTYIFDIRNAYHPIPMRVRKIGAVRIHGMLRACTNRVCYVASNKDGNGYVSIITTQ